MNVETYRRLLECEAVKRFRRSDPHGIYPSRRALGK